MYHTVKSTTISRQMREVIENLSANYNLYAARDAKYAKAGNTPFLVSPTPLRLTESQTSQIESFGQDIFAFTQAATVLYQNEDTIRNILDANKPEIFLTGSSPNYLFVRPDLIITPQGFAMCEMETSPFGLALAQILTDSYTQVGMETLVSPGALSTYVSQTTPPEGAIVNSQNTIQYKGQMEYLADNVFSSKGRKWESVSAQDLPQTVKNIFRAFYLVEHQTDSKIKEIFQSNHRDSFIPSLTPFFEEKALLALIWDRRWAPKIQRQIGTAAFNHLRSIVPPTWIVGQEQFFEPGLPNGFSSTVELATISKSKRAFVVKPSGFSEKGSWSEGVVFLNGQSHRAAHDLLAQVSKADTLYVVQEFKEGQKFPLEYEDYDGTLRQMDGRIRLTPYYALLGKRQGELIGVKATACQNTQYIHSTSASINASVGK